MTKLRWSDDEGRKLYAGGIVLTDTVNEKEGLWTLVEKDNAGLVHGDIGGRYDFNDGDIYATIAREFREELYNTAEIPYSVLVNLPPETHIYTYGHQLVPVYLCIVTSAESVGLKNKLEKIDVESAKQRVVQQNPEVPSSWYRTIGFKFITFEDIKSRKCAISRRFGEVITESFLYDKIAKCCGSEGTPPKA